MAIISIVSATFVSTVTLLTTGCGGQCQQTKQKVGFNVSQISTQRQPLDEQVEEVKVKLALLVAGEKEDEPDGEEKKEEKDKEKDEEKNEEKSGEENKNSDAVAENIVIESNDKKEDESVQEVSSEETVEKLYNL